jgi:uncharacterized membrane protein
VPAVTSLAVSTFELSLFVHISAAIVGFGATFAEAVMFPVAMRVGKKHLPYVHALQLAINLWMATPALLLVLLTGIYQVSDADYDFGDFWISGSLTIVVILGGLSHGYFVPSDRRLGPMVAAELAAGGEDVELSEEYQRAARKQGMVGAVTGLLVLIAVYLMVTKPGL